MAKDSASSVTLYETAAEDITYIKLCARVAELNLFRGHKSNYFLFLAEKQGYFVTERASTAYRK